MRCLVAKLCKYVVSAKGQYITIRPGRLLGLKGYAARKVEEALINKYGCLRTGKSYYKVICPKEPLLRLCKDVYELVGTWE